jgi:hypothetical protein
VADLVTHLCTALLPGAFTRGRLVPLVAVGTVLPDAVGRAVPLALERVAGAGLAVPPWALWPWAALHEPVGWLALCSAIGATFVCRDRVPATVALWLGCALHTALDVLQHHHGEGYLLLAPFSAARLELGWIGSEATVPLAPPLAAVTAAAWLPAAVEAAGLVPPWRPRALLVLVLPIFASAWLGASAAGWTAAGALAFAAATWRWWSAHPAEYASAGLALAAAAVAAQGIAQ